MTTGFRINEPDVSAEVFDSEILAINLRSGHYHSLRESAAPIWRLLVEGHPPATIVAWLAPLYRVEPAVIEADVAAVIADLQTRELIVARTESVASSAEAPVWLAGTIQKYAPPVLENYTDMQDLLLLDPIHDVDVTGWPHKPADDGKTS